MGLKNEQVRRILENLQRIALLVNSLMESGNCIEAKARCLSDGNVLKVIDNQNIYDALKCTAECIRTKTSLLKEEHNALYNDIQGMLEASNGE
jgi:hypothetical protein